MNYHHQPRHAFSQPTPAVPTHNPKNLKKFIIDHYHVSPSWGQVIRSVNSSRCIYKYQKIINDRSIMGWFNSTSYGDRVCHNPTSRCLVVRHLLDASWLPSGKRWIQQVFNFNGRSTLYWVALLVVPFGCQAYLPDLFRPVQSPSSNTASNPCSISRDLFPIGTGQPGYLPISSSGTTRLSSRLRSGHDSCSVHISSTCAFYSLQTVLRGHWPRPSTKRQTTTQSPNDSPNGDNWEKG